MAAFATWLPRLLACAVVAARALPGAGQEAAPAGVSADDEIVVRGKSPAELRLEIELARDALIARFNEINSDDRFDIHCRFEKRYHSNIEERVCSSNSWREQEASFGNTLARELRGEAGAIPQQYRAEQLRMQRLLEEEMQRLAVEDPELRAAFNRLGRAMRTLDAEGNRSVWTLFREVPGGADGLPFGARHAFEVHIGAEPWLHRLTESTFTIDRVTGAIRRLELECREVGGRLEFAPGVEWKLPADWHDCLLRVRAKRGTSFVLYEFE